MSVKREVEFKVSGSTHIGVRKLPDKSVEIFDDSYPDLQTGFKIPGDMVGDVIFAIQMALKEDNT